MGNGRADRGNVTHLLRVADSHGVEMADKLFPDTVFILHVGLDTEFALDSLGCDTNDFLCKVGQLSHHRVDGGGEEGLVACRTIACNPEREVSLDNSSSNEGAMMDAGGARDLLHGQVGARKGKA